MSLPVGHPMFGRAIMCECLQAQTETKQFDELLRLSALDAFRDWTFDAFDRNVEGTAEAFRAAVEFARDPYGWLVLSGRPGCGKTHLAAAIANEAVRNRTQVLFTVVPELLDHLRATFLPTSTVQYDERFEAVRGTNLLVLDDLGTESATPWAQEKLYQLINHRYNYQFPTVITTNRRIERLDERLQSRICDKAFSKVIEMKATDYRTLKPGQRRPGAPGRTPSKDRQY